MFPGAGGIKTLATAAGCQDRGGTVVGRRSMTEAQFLQEQLSTGSGYRVKSCCHGPDSLFSLPNKETILNPSEKVAKSLSVPLPAHAPIVVLVTSLATSGC